MSLYDQIGKGYSETRRADPRITDRILALLDLPPNSLIADIGAGTGNYTAELYRKGHRALAIEPSEVMRAQSSAPEDVQWIHSVAENIPLADDCVDGAVVILAIHHFTDPQRALSEVLRITGNGPVVFFTFSPEKLNDLWLCHYFPYFFKEARDAFPEMAEFVRNLQAWTKRKVETFPFPLPRDLKDRFAASGWATPEIYLDDKVRSGISTFARMPEEEMYRGVSRLKADLESGDWESRFGRVLDASELDLGYSLVKVAQGMHGK